MLKILFIVFYIFKYTNSVDYNIIDVEKLKNNKSIKIIEGVAAVSNSHTASQINENPGELGPVPAVLSGPEALYYLNTHCFNKNIDRYEYQICPFRYVTQRRVIGTHWQLLGKWGKWKWEKNNSTNTTSIYKFMEYNMGENCGSGSETRKATVEFVCDDNTELDDYDDYDIDVIINNDIININNNNNNNNIKTNEDNIEVSSNIDISNTNDYNNNIDNDLNDYYKDRYSDSDKNSNGDYDIDDHYNEIDHYNDYHEDEAAYYRQNYENGEYGDEGFYDDLRHSMNDASSQDLTNNNIDTDNHDIISAEEDSCHTKLKLKVPISCHLLLGVRHKDDRVIDEVVIHNDDVHVDIENIMKSDFSTNNDKELDKCNCVCDNSSTNTNEISSISSSDEISISNIDSTTSINTISDNTSTNEKNEMIEILRKQVDALKNTIDTLNLL